MEDLFEDWPSVKRCSTDGCSVGPPIVFGFAWPSADPWQRVQGKSWIGEVVRRASSWLGKLRPCKFRLLDVQQPFAIQRIDLSSAISRRLVQSSGFQGNQAGRRETRSMFGGADRAFSQ